MATSKAASNPQVDGLPSNASLTYIQLRSGPSLLFGNLSASSHHGRIAFARLEEVVVMDPEEGEKTSRRVVMSKNVGIPLHAEWLPVNGGRPLLFVSGSKGLEACLAEFATRSDAD